MPDYGPLYQTAGNKFNIDPLLLQSVAEHESDQDPNAVGKPVTLPDGSVQQAHGLFQLMPGTAKQYNVNPTDPTSAAHGAANYLDDLLNQNDGNLRVALGIYSRTGPNSPYVNAVMNRYTGLTNAWTGNTAATPSPSAASPPQGPAPNASGPWWAGMIHQPNFAERQPGVLGAASGFNPNDPAWQAQNLVQIPVYGRASPVTVNKMAADSFSGFLGDLAQRGYLTPDVQGFNARAKTGGGGLSAHAYGNAIDINPGANPYEAAKLITNLPSDVSELAAKWGLTWGGDWNSPKDPMHFEWAGVNPTTGIDYRGGQPVTLVRNDVAAPGATQGGGVVAQQQSSPGGPAAPQSRDDLLNNLFSPPVAATQPPAAAMPQTVSPPAGPTTGSGRDDLLNGLFALPPAPAGAGATAAPSAAAGAGSPAAPAGTIEGAPVVGGSVVAPTQPVPGGPSGAPPTPTVEGAPVVPSAPQSWWERNVVKPVAAIGDPTQPNAQPTTGIPLLDNFGAGLMQSARDVVQTANNVDAYLAKNIPGYSALDSAVGYRPQDQTATAAQTQAYEAQHGGEFSAGAGRLAGNLLMAAPVGAVAGAVGAATKVLPDVAPYVAGPLEWATAGGLQNALTSAGQTPADWWHDFETGAAGGAALRGVTAPLRWLTKPIESATTAIADRLGIDLSTGQAGGATAKMAEDATGAFPGSGAAKFATQQRQQIAGVIGKEAGMGDGVKQITTADLNNAETRVGSAIENATKNITVPSAPLLGDFAHIENAATLAGPDTQQAHVFRNLSDQILNLASNNNGVIPGDQFARFIARGGPLDTALSSSVPEVRSVANGIKTSLLNAAQQGTPQTATALQDLQNARYQWKVIQTVRPAIDKTVGGSDEMSLPGLANAIRNEFDMTQTGNMQDLSKLLSGPLRALPSSGTAERALWQRILGGGFELGGGVGAAGSLVAGIPYLGAMAGPGAIAPALIGRYMRYGPGMGIDLPAPVNRLLGTTFDRFVPRAAGGPVGQNWLTGQQAPPQPVPGL